MDRRATQGAALIRLGGREIEYRFARRRRRTLGITIDAGGLAVAAPFNAPWRDIERFILDKERWILAKLEEWGRSPPPPELLGVSGEWLPLFGAPVALDFASGRRAVHQDAGRLTVVSPPSRALETLLQWLKATARATLGPRVEHFSALLGVPAPRLALSNARTQWGVCTEGGAIRLSWRLVHVDPALADYVVAHEVAHLVELNHSKRFWNLVASLYPGWREARERLELAGAKLPVIRPTKRRNEGKQ